MTHDALIHHIVNVPANIWATILDPGIQLMNVSHAQLCNRNGESINYLRSVSSTKAPLSPWPGSSSDGLTHILPCSLPYCAIPPSGPSSTHQPASSCCCLCRKPQVHCCGARDLLGAVCHHSRNINRGRELQACLEPSVKPWRRYPSSRLLWVPGGRSGQGPAPRRAEKSQMIFLISGRLCSSCLCCVQ